MLRRQLLKQSPLLNFAASVELRNRIRVQLSSIQTAHLATTKSSMSAKMQNITTDKANPAQGPYSQAIVTGNTIYVSGQIPFDSSGNPVEGGIAEKTRACADNIKAILEASGSSIADIVKCNVFITDMANFGELNKEYEKIFTHKPARSCVAVKQLPKDVPVEIECIAVKGAGAGSGESPKI